MCGRFFIDELTYGEIIKLVQKIDKSIEKKKEKIDIFPSEAAPIISDNNGGLLLENMKWGYPSPDEKGLLINARAETSLSKATFYQGIRKNRIIIPASGFYEWNKNKEKSIFTSKDEKVIYIAGFFHNFNGHDRFIILTTDANESMRPVHHRMPLIIEESEIKSWIFDSSLTQDFLKKMPKELERKTKLEQVSMFWGKYDNTQYEKIPLGKKKSFS